MSKSVNVRRFIVHAKHEDRHHSKVVVERGFEAAAMAWLDDAHVLAGPRVSVVVRDVDSGHEHCFQVDVETGETAACGQANESPPQPLRRGSAAQ